MLWLSVSVIELARSGELFEQRSYACGWIRKGGAGDWQSTMELRPSTCDLPSFDHLLGCLRLRVHQP